MKTTKPGAALAAAAFGLAIAGCSPAKRGAGPDQAPSQQTFQQIMQGEIDLQADRFWAASGVVQDADGEHSLAPADDAQWAQVRQALLTIIAASDKLTTPGRALVEPGAKIEDEGKESVASPEWIRAAFVQQRPLLLQRAAALKSVAQEGLVAVDHRDLAAIDAIGERLDAACESCHAAFWYPPQARQPGYRPPILPAEPPLAR